MATASPFWLPPHAATALSIGFISRRKVQRRYTTGQAPLVASCLAQPYVSSVRNGESLKRFLKPKIQAAGFTDERFAIERMGLTKGAISGWWTTGKISKDNLRKISQMPDIGASIHELMLALEGKDPAATPHATIEATSVSASNLAENVRRMVRFVPNYRHAAETAGVNPEIFEAPEENLRNATLLDLDLIAEALNTKPWILLHHHSKNLDQRLDLVEKVLEVIAQTNDEGRQAIVDAMKLARRIGELSTRPEPATVAAESNYSIKDLPRRGVVEGRPELRRYKPVKKS